MDDREALEAINKLEVGQRVKVHGDLIAVRDDFGIMIELQLAELEVGE